jgi:hypothetical protein
MIDRQLVGDVVLAALVAIPAAALARPDGATHVRTAQATTPVQNSAAALAPTAERQIGIYR